MKHIEHFIASNTSLFNGDEPGEGHFKRFEQRLDQLHRQQIRRSPVKLWMKIAAGLLILVTATFAVIELSTYNFSTSGTKLSYAGLPDEITDILHLYEQRTTTQLSELQQIAQNCPSTRSMVWEAQDEIGKMDRQMDNLISLAKSQPGNEQVQTALIRQCKAKETILNDVILQGKMQGCRDN